MTLKKETETHEKNPKLRHVSRKTCEKIVALELLTKKDLTQNWRNADMSHECPGVISARLWMDLAGPCLSQNDDDAVHFWDMPVLTHGKSRCWNIVIEPFFHSDKG